MTGGIMIMLAAYASVLLANRCGAEFDASRFRRLQVQLSRSAFWSTRFQALGLSANDLGEAPGKRRLSA